MPPIPPTRRSRPFTFERRELRADDVADRHPLLRRLPFGPAHRRAANGAGTYYPIVPGHEIVGRVTAVGPEVTNFTVGDLVAVGCLVDSCRNCSACDEGLEQYCEKGFTGTYNGRDRISGENTHGGYSDQIVVREEFVLKVTP